MIAFWNLENLYDTLDDPLKNDDDFTPDGINAWTGWRYWKKIDHLAMAISRMPSPAILGMCEIENRAVVTDIVRSRHLRAKNYQVVHIEGPDTRGVDPALIYDPVFFTFTSATSHRVRLSGEGKHITRDILLVCGTFGGEPLAVLVNHWPSRKGGELVSRANRDTAAATARRIVDSLLHYDPSRRIVLMGDLNDDPVSSSVRKVLGTTSEFRLTKGGLLYNAMEELYRDGIGTLAWQDSWNLFDQIMLSHHWFPTEKATWRFVKAGVCNAPFLRADYGNFRGYPFRTFSGGAYTAGYSDHFAAYIIVGRSP